MSVALKPANIFLQQLYNEQYIKQEDILFYATFIIHEGVNKETLLS